MQVLVRALGAKRCLEIGTFTGYSALAVALALPPAANRLLRCERGMDGRWREKYWRWPVPRKRSACIWRRPCRP
jgi:caffeoyl-CoA O-methyltransferase